ncbi:putative LPS assembly protein LptD [Ferruginibacter albus]|uniref:putative LPS assembly protein LptD n=1 Tax=Ferruginibacter albus TaxID=2875540 RepID=UPI001CC7026F|nr:putative LPS assembly protein LptD [Ferruginibacter albus]UAY53381.1 LPS-assembly protein LptD [Ferruginibacter albus]
MNNVYKGKAKYILAFVLSLLLFTVAMKGGNGHFILAGNIVIVDSPPPGPIDSSSFIPVQKSDSLTQNDSTKVSFGKKLTDTLVPKIDTFTIKGSKDSLDAPVTYHADDSMVLDVPAQRIRLYGKGSKAKYQDNELTAPGIEFDQKNHLVSATIQRDSTGKLIGVPLFVQGDFKSRSDTIKFNMKTGKGLTSSTYTQQGEIFVHGEKIKKISPDVFYAYKGTFTTCNLDTPHFGFVSKKIKFINKKMAITGPVHPEIEGVPLPIYLPFGIFPMVQGRHSGLIAPTFISDQTQGIAMQGLGYYKVLSDNWDIVFRGTLYSYGGWMLNVAPNYYKRYHYRGNFSLDLNTLKSNFQGDPDYRISHLFHIRWSHMMDSKARPGVNFSANVDAGSSGFNQSVPGNIGLNYTNQLSSSIQFSKVWKDKPFSLSLTASHNQNSTNKQFSVTLPAATFVVTTVYPFRRKEAVGTLKWYENIGVGLNTEARSQTAFSDDSLLTRTLSVSKQISKNFQWGASHNVPISLSLPPVGVLQLAPSVSYSERWYQQKLIRNWDEDANKLDTTIQKGFYSARSMSFGLSVSTRIFGMMAFGKNSKIQAIRHEIRPSISISYTPDMNSRFYYNTQVDSAGHTQRYSVFDGSLYGPFGSGRFGGLNFSVDNNIQMKVRNKKDTSANGVKKISLLDGLSLSGSYNFLVDSFQFSTFAISARTNLFNKVNFTASGQLDPYQIDSTGRRINTLVWKQHLLTLGRLMTGNISLSSSFKGGENKVTPGNSPVTQPVNYNPASGMPLSEYETEMAYINNNPAMFTDFSIPWSVNLSYSLNFSRTFNITEQDFQTLISQNVNIGGTLGLSPKWQLGFNGYYNITTAQLGGVSLSLSRDMHCWQMAITISPISPNRYFTFTINPKSGMLRDLKINRSRYFYDL